MADLDLNFQWVANAQTNEADARQFDITAGRFARLIVEEVALQASKATYAKANRTLKSQVNAVVRQEVQRMAMVIGRAFALPAKFSGPKGTMSLTGELSATGSEMWGNSVRYDRQDTGIGWVKRRADYMDSKRRKGFPENWWLRTGKLMKYLSRDTTYTSSFGGIQVRFNQDKDQGVLRRSAGTAINITKSGRPGRLTAEYRVGTVSVSVFNRITPEMLPAIARMADPNAPAYAMPAQGSDGLASLIKNETEKEKLLRTRKGARRRYALEPFVSFYLTRAIPNAVWKRIESTIQNVEVSRGRSGIEDFSAPIV